MTCGKNGMCLHDPRCSDHHCPGRGEPPPVIVADCDLSVTIGLAFAVLLFLEMSK